jgi:hypothetical protein
MRVEINYSFDLCFISDNSWHPELPPFSIFVHSHSSQLVDSLNTDSILKYVLIDLFITPSIVAISEHSGPRHPNPIAI